MWWRELVAKLIAAVMPIIVQTAAEKIQGKPKS